ncbi:ribonuclease III [Mycoplasmatota bacterium WC44]
MEKCNLLIELLEERFNLSSLDRDLVKMALTHKSYAKELADKAYITNYDLLSYQRLELLGDKVLGLVVTEYVFDKYPNLDEGILTKKVEQYVNNSHLFEIAKKMDLQDYLYLGVNLEWNNTKILADALEALIGAIYKSSNIFITTTFIEEIGLFGEVKTITPFESLSDVNRTNYKNALQELTQMQRASLPFYEVIDEWGDDHEKTFNVAVSIDGIVYGTGVGTRKKNAENVAAKNAIEEYRTSINNTFTF